MAAPFAIFCADPLDPRAVEPDFADEVEPARSAGFSVARLDHDDLDRRIDPASALRKTRFDENGKAVYRGWMISAEAYAALFTALSERDIIHREFARDAALSIRARSEAEKAAFGDACGDRENTALPGPFARSSFSEHLRLPGFCRSWPPVASSGVASGPPRLAM